MSTCTRASMRWAGDSVPTKLKPGGNWFSGSTAAQEGKENPLPFFIFPALPANSGGDQKRIPPPLPAWVSGCLRVNRGERIFPPATGQILASPGSKIFRGGREERWYRKTLQPKGRSSAFRQRTRNEGRFQAKRRRPAQSGPSL